MTHSRRHRPRRGSMFAQGEELSPMNSVGNVFDVAMVFSVALLLALVMSAGLTELLTEQDVTIVKNPGSEDMEIIVKTEEGITVLEMNSQDNISGGVGKVLGTAYQLEDGTIIYVPDANATSAIANGTDLLPALS